MSRTSTPDTIYVHVDDHKHNLLTWLFAKDWWWSCALPPPYKKRIWNAEILIIPLRHHNEEYGNMASKKSTAKASVPVDRGNAEFIGFVNINLTDDEMETVDNADHSDALMAGHIDYLLELGKVSLNYNRGSVNATLTVLEGISAGYAVSAYSDTLAEAVIILRLKVQNYLDKFESIYASGGTRKKRG